MAHSSEYRAKAIAFKEDGHTFTELTKVFGISSYTYYRWKEIKKARRKRKISAERLRDILEERPDSYLHEIAEEFGYIGQDVCAALKRKKKWKMVCG